MSDTAVTSTAPAFDAAQGGDYRRVLEAALGVPFTDGSRIERLVNGVEIFPAMIEAVDKAQTSVDFLTFIYWQGDIARRFGQCLAERARAGVRVRVLLDAFGAHSMPADVLALLHDAGAEVQWFRPKARWRIWQVDNRTHRKILLIDGQIGFTGGVGIAEEWDGDARNPDEWRETHFRMVGPVVDGLIGAFVSNWVEAGASPVDGEAWPRQQADAGQAQTQVLRTSAAVNYSDIATLFRLMIGMAQQRLRITTGYFVPDEATLALLEEAAARGVTIEILMPGPHTDSRVARMAGEAVFERLLTSGVQLFRYQPTMLHAKVLLLDDSVAVIGSANFNHRSMGKDDEIAMTVIDPTLFTALSEDFDNDRRSCEAVDRQAWQRRGLWQRVREQIGRLLSSQA